MTKLSTYVTLCHFMLAKFHKYYNFLVDWAGHRQGAKFDRTFLFPAGANLIFSLQNYSWLCGPSWSIFWVHWVLKLVLHRHLLYLSLVRCGFILLSWLLHIIFYFKKLKNCTQITHVLILASNLIFNFPNLKLLSELHRLNLKLCCKHYNKIDLLHLIVVL